MALSLAIQGQSRFDGLPGRNTLVRWVAAALERDGDLTLRFVGAAEGRKLNREYRGRDYATNVLTFGYEHAPVVRADIVLCIPVVKREAREQGKPFRGHLCHLVVHGVLHAQGLQHDRAADAKRMEALEVRILSELGVANPYLPRGGAGAD